MRVTAELLARYDRPGPRYTSYPTAVDFSPDVGPLDHQRLLRAAAARPEEPLSLYVHLPFCAARCSFCACHAVITTNPAITGGYLERVAQEAELVATGLGQRRRLAQYHWGGGTPTSYPPHLLESLHTAIAHNFDLQPDAEMAVEVDPRVTTEQHLETLRHLGFNRISAGVQDFDPRVQELIGRNQTPEQTDELVTHARKLGFGSINLDLVYGLPGQSVAGFERTLQRVIELAPERLAVYSFAYIPRARLHQRRIDPEQLPDRDTRFRLLALTVTSLTDAGYLHVGMDHFALPGDELATAASAGTLTRNFMGYTTRRGTDLVALGTSGISEVAGAYLQNHRRLASYLSAVQEGRSPVERGVILTSDDQIRRRVITDLMCSNRVDLAEVGEAFGVDPERYFATELALLHDPSGLVAEGLAAVDGVVVAATELGRVFIRRLAMVFDAYVERRPGGRPPFSQMV